MKRTGTEAGAPASGSVTCCVLTSVPSSSTSSVTFCPSKPDCDSTTSTISVVPLSAVFGVATRPTWMSFDNVSRPTPTVNTGSASALRPSSASPSAASAVSAPSLTITSPATGSPASSCRTPDSAAPSRVCEPLNVSSLSCVVRVGARREAERPHGEPIGQRLEQPAIVRAELALHERGARLAVDISNLHAARVVQQHADEVLLRHRGLDHQQRPEQADQDDGEERDADAGERRRDRARGHGPTGRP